MPGYGTPRCEINSAKNGIPKNKMNTLLRKAKNILWLIKPYWKYGKWVIIYGLIHNGLICPLGDLLYVYTPQIVVDALDAGRGIAYVALLTVALYAISFVTYAASDYYWELLNKVGSERARLKIRKLVYDKAEATDYAKIDDPDFYDKYKWAQDNFTSKSQDAVNMCNNLIRGIMCILTLASVIATVSPWAIVIVTVYACLRLPVNARMNKYEIARDEAVVPFDRRLDYVHRLFYMKDYAADLRSTRLPEIFRRHYDEQSEEKLVVVKKYSKKVLWLDILLYALYEISQCLIMLLIVWSFYRGDIKSSAVLVTMFMAAGNLAGDLWDITAVVKDYDRLSGYSERIRAFFDMPSVIESSHGEVSVPDGEFSLELRDVGFRYTESGPFVLRHLSLKIAPGERLAVVGENGAGKSTLLKLLLRLYDVTEGEILVNGVNIKEYDPHELRARVGVAFQDTNVYAMSMRENIGLCHEFGDRDIDSIIGQFGVDRILEKNGVDVDCEMTREFSERGVVVSGGEAQKLALTRLLTYPFGLYLLDEPSSALDPLAEYEMTKTIVGKAAGKTTLLIAHRLSSVREMDRIVLISGGVAAESGTHDELMRKNGIYAAMFQKQAEGYRE